MTEQQTRDYAAELLDQVRLVGLQRIAYAAKKAELDTLRQKFEADNAKLITEVTDNTAFLLRVEQELRELTLEAYKATGDKKPGLGVSVKVFAALEYIDSDAIEWAESHGHTELVKKTLDKRKFEAIALALPDSAPVIVREEPRAQIATDLGKALE